jgi:hypothetical protein
MASSAGGPRALGTVIGALPRDFPASQGPRDRRRLDGHGRDGEEIGAALATLIAREPS